MHQSESVLSGREWEAGEERAGDKKAGITDLLRVKIFSKTRTRNVFN